MGTSQKFVFPQNKPKRKPCASGRRSLVKTWQGRELEREGQSQGGRRLWTPLARRVLPCLSYTVWRSPTAGKMLAFPVMGCDLISFTCFPRTFPRPKQGPRALLISELVYENPVKWLKTSRAADSCPRLKGASELGSSQRNLFLESSRDKNRWAWPTLRQICSPFPLLAWALLSARLTV